MILKKNCRNFRQPFELCSFLISLPIRHIRHDDDADSMAGTGSMENMESTDSMAVSDTGGMGNRDAADNNRVGVADNTVADNTAAVLPMHHRNLVLPALQIALHCLQADRSTQEPPFHF